MGQGMSEILPGIFLGSFRDCKDKDQMEKNHITHILAIHDNAKPIIEGKTYLCITASDKHNENILQYFEECILFIHQCRQSGGKVLIHCLAGISRSTTVTVAYLMTISDFNWYDCLRVVRHIRSVALPNFGFQKQLQEFEHTKLTEMKQKIKEQYPEYSSKEDCKQMQDILESYLKMQKEKNKNLSKTNMQDSEDFLYPLPYKAYESESEK
ncbi:Dual specificity protein phosphatase 22 [Holothuria leucospilota]|uniref:Dual specificity protein phosphatase 15 n=1 Tax=Holothuria leucospilota TaxID=206669 RepID=A0A9Q1CCD4_HOLLE|nr:Dual specificity protein phosphatase 22 [Holothuria leucospilota]